MSNFTYLHLHTRFSRAGGPAAPLDWCSRASHLGYSALGVADRSPMAAFPAVHFASRQAGITPLYGLEIDLILPNGDVRKAEPACQPALLFARNKEGIHNLAVLASEAYSGWPATEKPVAFDALAANASGILLILLGGDEAGALSPFVTASAKKLAEWGRAIKALFNEAAFTGLPHAGRPGDHALAAQVATAAGAMGVPVVATPTARYLRSGDAPAYEALKVARRRVGWPQDGARGLATTSIASDRDGHDYLRSPEEAAALFAQWPQAVENVARVIEMCTMGDGCWVLGVGASREGRAFLASVVEKKLGSLPGANELPTEVRTRLEAELDVIDRQGAAGAWVALASLGELAHDSANSIPLGAPLGIANGSLLAYAFGLSPLNPIEQAGPAWLTTAQEPLPLPGVEAPAARLEALHASLTNEYGPNRVAYAASILEVTPVQAVQAAASVLSINGDDLKTLLQSALEKGWDGLSLDAETPDNIIRLATLAVTLKGAPLTFKPDKHIVVVAPRPTHGSHTLLSYGPLLSTNDDSSHTWLPWTEHDLAQLNYPALTLRPTHALSALEAALSLARQYPIPGFQADKLDLQTLPALGEATINILRKGELAGIPYISAKVVKDWLGEAVPEANALSVALASSLQTPISSYTAHAWARIALWEVALKAAHPAAFLAGTLTSAYAQRGRAGIASLAEEARRLNISLKPPDVNLSAANPSLQREGEGWAIVWGLDLLPGWHGPSTGCFISARPPSGFQSLREVAVASTNAGFTTDHIATLIQSGACDTLGGKPRNRQTMLSSLPAMMDWAQASHQSSGQLDLFSTPAPQPPIEEDLQASNTQHPTPNTHSTLRAWEDANLGVAFTPTVEMDNLRAALEKSGALRARLLTTAQIDIEHIGTSVNLVGLLTSSQLLDSAKGESGPLAVAWLEDLEGSIELVAFPPNYKRHAHLWVENNMVVVTARVGKHPDGDLYLLSEHLAPFGAGSPEEALILTVKPPKPVRGTATATPSAPNPQHLSPSTQLPTPITYHPAPNSQLPSPVTHDQPTYSLIISLPPANDDHVLIDSMIGLKNLLSQHPGSDSVTLRVQYSHETGNWTSGRLPWGVRYTHQLESGVRRLLGDDALAVIKLLG